MSDDPSSTNGQHRSWLERLGLALTGEPKTRDELIDLLREAQQRDLLDADALAMMEGVMEVSEMQVRDVMIPRSQMVVLERDWPFQRMLDVIVESGHSRVPVIGESRDEVLGILLSKDLLRDFGADEHPDILSRLRPAKFIPESKRLNTLLKDFRSTRLHMAIVVDEYGGVAGLVTIEDVLEQIVGEIDDEHDADEDADVRALSDTHFIVRALTPVEDFNEQFDAGFDEDQADTVGGLIMMDLGHLPKRNEVITLGRFRFRVLRADNRRIHLLELKVLDTAVDGEGEADGEN